MWPLPVVLSGFSLRLERLEVRHAEDLLPPADAETLRYLNLWEPVEDVVAMREQVKRVLASGDAHFFAVIDQATGRAVGSTSYLDLRPAHRSLEIGNTWLAPSTRGTHVNPEMKRLLLTYAFEALGCVRVQLKTDGRNLQSQAALRKLGATYEGTLRQHLICRDGFIRDTVMFSILASEWPAVCAKIDARLTPA
jgi:RimJ/RimL family protein N-acetyltransferase